MNENNASNPNKSSIGCIFGIIIIIVLLLLAVSQCSTDDYKQQEIQKFGNQLKKDPRNWNNEEKRRYNNYADWLEKQ